MEWRSITFDWNQVRAFLVASEEGSLSAAARALCLTQPTLGRRVAAREASLVVMLFDRVGKSLKLTEAGRDLLEHARAMGAVAGRVFLSASGRSQAIKGHVCVTASDLLSAYALPPVVAHLRDIAPGIRLEVVASNSLRDLSRREADIAIRHLRPDQPDRVARRVSDGRARLFASRAYLDRVGRPKTSADLARLSSIGFDRGDALLDHLNAVGLDLTEDRFQTYCGNGIVVWQMLRQGLGVAVTPSDLAATDPSVEAILPDVAPLDFPVWLVAHRELHTSLRIRLVFDTLAAALTRQPEGRSGGVVTGHPIRDKAAKQDGAPSRTFLPELNQSAKFRTPLPSRVPNRSQFAAKAGMCA